MFNSDDNFKRQKRNEVEPMQLIELMFDLMRKMQFTEILKAEMKRKPNRSITQCHRSVKAYFLNYPEQFGKTK